MQLKGQLKKLISKFPKIKKALAKFLEHPFLYVGGVLVIIYLYGIAIHSFIAALGNFTSGASNPTFTLNPIKCIAAAFTPQGLGVIFFLFIMYALISGRWIHLITGVKITKDERNFFVSNEGTHGTSGWMTKKEREKILVSGSADSLPCPILCKVKDRMLDDDRYADYLGLRDDSGLNKHIIVYGATGSGKSRGLQRCTKGT